VAYVIELLDASHDREPFDCGDPALNEYLKKYARQNQERGIGRTYVAIPHGALRVVGFYTLSAGSVAFMNAPDHLRKRLPRYPVPVAHLGRLATCESVRGRGLGEALLFDALARAARIADEIGVVAVEVRAKNELARAFYAKYGFEALVDDKHHLYLPPATVREVIEP
jgi:ribosomal protein S18 acetylase RimI-like enzyme